MVVVVGAGGERERKRERERLRSVGKGIRTCLMSLCFLIVFLISSSSISSSSSSREQQQCWFWAHWWWQFSSSVECNSNTQCRVGNIINFATLLPLLGSSKLQSWIVTKLLLLLLLFIIIIIIIIIIYLFNIIIILFFAKPPTLSPTHYFDYHDTWRVNLYKDGKRLACSDTHVMNTRAVCTVYTLPACVSLQASS